VPDSTKKVIRKQKKEQKIKAGKTIITPVGAPAYTPELGLLVAGGVLASFRFSKTDTNLPRSTLPATIGVSTTGAIVIQARLNAFFWHDKIRLNAELWHKNMPDHYWGVGYNSAQAIEKGANTTRYHRSWYWFNPELLYQFKKSWFIGGAYDLNYTYATEFTQYHLSDEDIKRSGTEFLNSGMGITFLYDTRDVPVNAYNGIFLGLRTKFYRQFMGSDFEYQNVQIDLRKYFTLNPKGRVLALQSKGNFTAGDTPFTELPQLGSPFDLRGYYWGWYRDNNSVFILAEYRHKFKKIKSSEWSKMGGVVWVGIGSVSPTWNNYTYWLPNAGIGFRYELQPRLNLRIDFGVGYNSTGFYFNFNEAF
jgi:outer membrane protein assembly factor BamA